jgi:hypothetical protein
MRCFAVAVLAVSFAAIAQANMLPPERTTGRAYFAGTWSFDGTCMSGDGMVLAADGKASYDEWGTGLWATADSGTRLVLIVEDVSEEADRRKQAEMIEFRDVSRTGPVLRLTRTSDGAAIKAKRCPTTAP